MSVAFIGDRNHLSLWGQHKLGIQVWLIMRQKKCFLFLTIIFLQGINSNWIPIQTTEPGFSIGQSINSSFFCLNLRSSECKYCILQW
jgi:hypothetical protein